MTKIRRAVPLALALLLAACQSAPAPKAARPTLYDDLASPTARVDQQRALSMINQYRAANGIPTLRLDPKLSRSRRTTRASWPTPTR